MDASQHGTSEITMLAAQVVEQQSKYCAAKMENLEDKVDALARQVERLTECVDELKTSLAAAKVEIAVQKTRVGLWAAVGGSLPVIVMLLIQWLEQ